MISLEQIQALNAKVNKAIQEIFRLREENGELKTKLLTSESRLKELESLVLSFTKDQQDIETGILTILEQLDKLEGDFFSKQEKTPPAQPAGPEKPAAEGGFPTAHRAPPPAGSETQSSTENETSPPVPDSSSSELDIF